MASTPVFDQSIPGFVPYRDNGDGTFTPRVAADPLAGTFVSFLAVTPATNAVLATLSLAAGTWRIDYAVGGSDNVSAINKYIAFRVGANTYDLIPVPGRMAGSIAAITLGAATDILMVNALAFQGGAVAAGYIAAYPVAT